MTDRFLKKKKRLLIFYRKLYKNVKIERILKKDFEGEKKDYLIIDEKFKKKNNNNKQKLYTINLAVTKKERMFLAVQVFSWLKQQPEDSLAQAEQRM